MDKKQITEIGTLTQNIFQVTQLLKVLKHEYYRGEAVQIEFSPNRLSDGIYERIEFSNDYVNFDKNVLIGTLEIQLENDKKRLLELTENFK